MGDEVAVPRSIDHLIRVPRSRADSLVADLEAAGFRVYNRKSRVKVSIEFDRDDAVDQESAAAFTREVMALADRHGGEYDGWGALILPKDRQQHVPPDDLIAPQDVDVQTEQARLRTLYADRLIADGCPEDRAAAMSRKVMLKVGPESWGLETPDSTTISMGHYSPSEALELLAEVAESAIEDNMQRRKPLWPTSG